MSYLKEISKYKTPELQDYLDYKANPTERKKNELINGNLQLVFNLAKKYQSYVDSFTFDDLVQEGTLGLYEALERFNPEKGYKFSTYAGWFIMGNIISFLKANSLISKSVLSVEEEQLKQLNFRDGEYQDSVLDIVSSEEMDLSQLEASYIRDYLKDMDRVLTAREYDVICHLYGYNKYKELNEAELADKLDVTTQSIRLIKNSAIEKLKQVYK